MNYFKYLLCISVALLTFSCSDSDDEEEAFGILISPAGNYLTKPQGSIVNFSISIQSNESLSRFRISEEIDNNGATNLIDQSIQGKNYSDFFDYTVPDSFDFGSHEIKIIFSTLDVRGNLMQRAKIINVNVTDEPLTEFGGNTMYSSLSNQFDAYDLLLGSPIYSSDTLAHIRDLSMPNPTDSLSKAWTSPVPEIKFVRFNNFDYSNATKQSVKTAYNTGVKNDTIRNLREDDILLTKIEDNFLAVKLIFVTDQPGNTNDRYIFSIKR